MILVVITKVCIGVKYLVLRSGRIKKCINQFGSLKYFQDFSIQSHPPHLFEADQFDLLPVAEISPRAGGMVKTLTLIPLHQPSMDVIPKNSRYPATSRTGLSTQRVSKCAAPFFARKLLVEVRNHWTFPVGQRSSYPLVLSGCHPSQVSNSMSKLL